MAERTDVLALEPWLGGSHRAFLDAWVGRSRHAVRVEGLPPRRWRWRQESSAWELARRVAPGPRPDVLVVSDYVDLARLRGFLPAAWGSVPALAYFHENQLTYPTRPDRASPERDLAHGWSNVLTCLVADALAFNSTFHLAAFTGAADAFLARMPRPNPRAELVEALDAAAVVPPLPELADVPLGPGPPADAPLRVAFPHRWEHDKDPVAFLDAVAAARRAGADVQVVLLGEDFGTTPSDFDARREELDGAIVHAGREPDREVYLSWLGACDVVASTARHEFFGVAIAEGVAAGCRPLAPRRLAYPETLAYPPLHEDLYEGEEELVARLVAWARDPAAHRDPAARADRRRGVLAHDAATSASMLDALLPTARRPN